MTPHAFDAPLAAVETSLDALAQALRADDVDVLAHCCSELQSALIALLRSRRDSAPLPDALRERLIAARGQIAGQRESVARASAAAARAAAVLMPDCGVYDLRGRTQPRLRLGTAQA